jgi:hypothetical protein
VSANVTESLKWILGLPAAILALLTLPHVVIKYRLECKKLRYEIQKIEAELPSAGPAQQPKQPGAIFTWMAHYWPIPCYGSMTVFGVLAAIFRSPILAGFAVGVSLMFLIIGSAIAERYTQITGRPA